MDYVAALFDGLPVDESGKQFADEFAEPSVGIFLRYVDFRPPAGACLKIRPLLYLTDNNTIQNILQVSGHVAVMNGFVAYKQVVVNEVDTCTLLFRHGEAGAESGDVDYRALD